MTLFRSRLLASVDASSSALSTSRPLRGSALVGGAVAFGWALMVLVDRVAALDVAGMMPVHAIGVPPAIGSIGAGLCGVLVVLATQRMYRARACHSDQASQGFQALVASVPCAVFQADRAGRWSFANADMERLTGRPAAGLLDDAWLQGVETDDRHTVDAFWRAAVSHQCPSFRRFRLRDPNGALRWIAIRSSPVHDGAGDVVGHVGVFDDLSERKRMEEELLAAREATTMAQRAKDAFLATMSHELRTPLNGIFGMTELALDATDEDERRDYLGRVRVCATGLMEVLDDVLSFAYIGQGAVPIACDEFEPAALLADVLDALSVEARRKDLSLSGSVDPTVPHSVKGDAMRFRQVIMLIAGNALKFTEQGSVDLRMDLDPGAVEARTAQLRCAVRDTGIGIPLGRRDRIFDAFVQGDDSPTRRYPGIGLGLANASKLVALLSGRIELESELGQGSCFRCSAQVAMVDAAEMGTSRAQNAPRAGARP